MGADPRLLVVMDVDSTFIREEVVELLAAHAGREAEVRAVTEAAMRGEVDFAESLRRRVEVLAGLDAGVVDEVRRSVTVTPGARRLLAHLDAGGHVSALVSGGFIEIVGPLARDHGVPHARANVLEIRDGRLTGRLAGPIVDRAAKASALREFAAEHGIDPAHTVAVGDGANDIDMLEAAGVGIAFCAKDVLRAHADVVVDEVDLAAVVPVLDRLVAGRGR